MNIKKVVFISTDEDYVAALEYRISEIIGKNAELEFITSKEYLKEYLSVPKRIDILVMPESMRGIALDKINIDRVFYLTEHNISEDTSDKDDTIYKYASVRTIVEKLDENLFSEAIADKKKGTKTISIFSASGGCGKTLVALSVAQNLSRKGNRVLYINTLDMQDFEFYLETRHKLSDNFTYQCTINIKNALKMVENEIKTEGFDYLPAFRKLPITYHIELETYLDIIKYIKSRNTYDYIVVELSAQLSAIKIAFMQECERNLIVTTQDEVAIKKLEAFLANMYNMNNSVTILCNRCSDSRVNYLEVSSLSSMYEISEYVEENNRSLTFEDVRKYQLFAKTTVCVE